MTRPRAKTRPGLTPASPASRRPHSHTPALPHASPPPDPEALAVLARAQRTAACSREVFAAVEPILARHRCRLSTLQEVRDGRPGDVQIVIVPAD